MTVERRMNKANELSTLLCDEKSVLIKVQIKEYILSKRTIIYWMVGGRRVPQRYKGIYVGWSEIAYHGMPFRNLEINCAYPSPVLNYSIIYTADTSVCAHQIPEIVSPISP